jgi:hypothetical protein
VLTTAKTVRDPAKCAVNLALIKEDPEIEAINLSGIVLARLRAAHLLLSLPCALKKA